MRRLPPPIGFVLVHGGFHGGWCWDALRPLLGAPTVAIDLPGRSGRPADHAAIAYDDWVAAATAQSLALAAEGIVLVGHSLAGITLPQVAIRLGARLRAIVFVASVAPPEGERFDLHYAGGPVAAPTWELPPPEVAASLLCTGMDEDETAALLARLNSEPAGPLTVPISRRGAPDVPALYVRAQDDATGLGPLEFARLACDFPQLKLVDAPGGHNLMMTRPDALANILGALAANLR